MNLQDKKNIWQGEMANLSNIINKSKIEGVEQSSEAMIKLFNNISKAACGEGSEITFASIKKGGVSVLDSYLTSLNQDIESVQRKSDGHKQLDTGALSISANKILMFRSVFSKALGNIEKQMKEKNQSFSR